MKLLLKKKFFQSGITLFVNTWVCFGTIPGITHPKIVCYATREELNCLTPINRINGYKSEPIKISIAEEVWNVGWASFNEDGMEMSAMVIDSVGKFDEIVRTTYAWAKICASGWLSFKIVELHNLLDWNDDSAPKPWNCIMLSYELQFLLDLFGDKWHFRTRVY